MEKSKRANVRKEWMLIPIPEGSGIVELIRKDEKCEKAKLIYLDRVE